MGLGRLARGERSYLGEGFSGARLEKGQRNKYIALLVDKGEVWRRRRRLVGEKG